MNKSDALQAIQQPEQREMIRRYQLAQNLLQDAKRTNNKTKLDECHEAMNDVAMLRDRQNRVHLPLQQKQ